jgi:2-polyprenyl-3-methyl-5-hydroxy-6-metoxy-1,4-benzoquinol methylase
VPLFPDLRSRRREPELMDDAGLDPAEHRRALDGLARLNAASGAFRSLWDPIAGLAREDLGRPLRVLDVATGAGEFPVTLAQWAGRAGLRIGAAGCDLSETALAYGREIAAAVRVPVTFFRQDVLNDPLPDGYDVVTCSLFLHHLDEPYAVRLLREMGRAAGKLVLVNDLTRGPVNYALVRLACRLLSRSPVVRYDGPASVRAAFTPGEARELAERAGLRGATVAKKFPCRFLLAWRKPV